MPIILGIDPGLATTGYGAIRADENLNRLEMIACGIVHTPPEKQFPERLEIIYQSIHSLVGKFDPSVIAVEELFFNKNVKTAIAVGHARGVIVLAGQTTETELFEYNPRTIKKTLTGSGSSDKKAVQKMVMHELNLPSVPEPDDAADALATAICHLLLERFDSKIPKK